MESGHIVLSSVQTETLVSRMSIKEDMAYKRRIKRAKYSPLHSIKLIKNRTIV